MEDIFKALGDENRLRIVNLLRNGELCVCELEGILETTQSNVSRHLNRLKNSNIVVSEKNAQWVYYSLSENFINDNNQLYKYLCSKMDNSEIYKEDSKKIGKFKLNNTCNIKE